jgi:phosphate starvation-inducible PhoH-like protein
MESLIIPAALMPTIFGQLDANMRKIEQAFAVTVILRDDGVNIMPTHPSANIGKAEKVLEHLASLAGRGEAITEQRVNYAIAA